jgi:hypothetical protein
MSKVVQVRAAIARHRSAVPTHLDLMGSDPGGAGAETALAGWACRIRTDESVRELPDWNSVTTSLK